MAIDYGVGVRMARSARGMTQRELSAAAGLNPGYISFIEKNERRMTTDTLTKVAMGLRLPVWALIVLGSFDEAPEAVRCAVMALLSK